MVNYKVELSRLHICGLLQLIECEKLNERKGFVDMEYCERLLKKAIGEIKEEKN